MANFRIKNEFGIKPTKNFKAAGWDFYIPKLTEDKKDIIIAEFEKSYKQKAADIEKLINILEIELKEKFTFDVTLDKILNAIHLFYALRSGTLERVSNYFERIEVFLKEYLIYDDTNEVFGLCLKLNDHLFINSGIRTALDPDTVGVFLNKSGRGNNGFAIRAQVIDEDYTGIVHLSVAYTRDNETCGKIYCGDKLTQMLVIPLVKYDDIEELDTDTYSRAMATAERGTDGFGSSNEIH